MKLTPIFILIIFYSNNNVYGQTRIITGRVIDEHLNPIYQARINNSDTILLGMTEVEGRFKIEIPVETKTLLISWIDTEWKFINLPINCDHLDIILQYIGSYDFMSARKVDRLRMKQFKKLPELHWTAYKKSIFVTEKLSQLDIYSLAFE